MHLTTFCVAAALAVALFGAGCKPAESTTAAPAKPAKPAATAATDAPAPLVAMPELSPDEPVVTVNSQVLSRAQATLLTRRLLMSQRVPEEQMDEFMAQMGDRLRQQVVDQFITSTLLKQEAVRRHVEVADSEVDGVLSNLTGRLPPGTNLEEALSSMGTSLAEVRRDIRENESIRKVYEAETAAVAVPTDAEVAAFYETNAERFQTDEKVRARHILIGCREEDDAAKHTAAKEKIAGLRKQLVEGGADFAALAQAHSDCPSGKAAGGDLGAFGRGNMVPPFEEAAFSLATNVVSEVVTTPFGYHLIQVIEHNQAGKQPLDGVRADISRQMLNERRNESFRGFVDGLRAQATIVPVQPPPPVAPTGRP